ncbi:MAG TPA: VOC family protein, partial [Pirellulales bacterium]|nr:VOC family protein [Pirellulales bacterium]
LVMSLLPNSQLHGGTLYHLGLRLQDSETLVRVQRRLEEAGVRTRREEGVECCYARQTKFWVTDPDLNLWELYVIAEDLDHHGMDLPPSVTAEPEVIGLAKRTWEHRLSQPLPERIPHDDNSLDEVRLEGTFGLARTPEETSALLAECYRALRPGGRIHVHNLVADRPFADRMPELPGPAAVVKYVPLEAETLGALERAGFHGLHYDKLGDLPCFAFAGVELREMRLSGAKPHPTAHAHDRPAIYKGPFKQVTDDAGHVYACGRLAATAGDLRSSLQDAVFDKHFETVH